MNKKDLKSILASFMETVWNNGDFSQIEAFVAPKYEIVDDPGDPWDKQIADHRYLSTSCFVFPECLSRFAV